MTERRLVVPVDLAGVRVDRMIATELGLSRARAREIIDSGGATCDGVPVRPRDRLSAGTTVIIDYPDAPQELTPDEGVPFSVVHEDRDLIVVDKPIGVVVHPGSGSATGTLANGLLSRYPELEGVGQADRWGIVHRLDRDTSGLLVVARNQISYERLVDMMRNRVVSRRYLTVVAGRFTNTTGTIDAPIGRDPMNPTRMSISGSGRNAVTHYRRLAQWTDRCATLLSVTLQTGRTHQIRVHMRAIDAPIIGDTAYGRRGVIGDPGRPWLHARQLAFTHPMSGERLDVVSPLPGDLCDSLNALGVPDVGDRTDVEGTPL
ncbi:MAG: RluA family pseudouridine synthase [Acidimicrobiia bacterium]|nr:MAG: RluA family pseudouridine synthase [Acidimicrobiia bacterium]